MGVIADRERLIDGLVRLRRAQQYSPARDDIAAVRADLESLVGASVTRALAARLLGVSQTTLDQWVASSDIPVVLTHSGRREVPLHALVQLIAAVRDRRTSHPHDRQPLATVLREHREKADRLSTAALLRAADRAPGQNAHRDAELRGLAYHRAVAQRLDEELVEDARHRLARWRSQDRIGPRYAARWEEVLARPTASVAQAIARNTPRMNDLRQNSPFAGALTEAERRRVLAAVRGIAA